MIYDSHVQARPKAPVQWFQISSTVLFVKYSAMDLSLLLQLSFRTYAPHSEFVDASFGLSAIIPETIPGFSQLFQINSERGPSKFFQNHH